MTKRVWGKNAGTAMTILALGATLGLSGCATSGMDTAATIDGRVISESQMQAALAQLQEVADITPDQFLNTMIQGPVLEQKAAGQPFQMSTEKAISEIRAQVGIQDPEPLLVEFVRYNYYGQNLAQAGIQVTPADLEALDVSVNPRYGTWDPAQSVLTVDTPAWISSEPSAGTDS